MPISLPIAPKEPDLFDIDNRASSPVEDDEESLGNHEGLELTVYGLDRKTTQSAVEHLQKLIREVQKNTERTPEVDNIFKAIRVQQASSRTPLDYAYIYLDAGVIAQPRADILQALRKTLIKDNPTIRVLWRTHSGPDKTRRLTFPMDSQKQAHEMAPKLQEWMEKKKYPVLMKYVSRPNGTWRITIDLIEPDHVDAVFSSPPVIGGKTFYPTRPRYIIPTYGYQVGVLGCRDWHSAQRVLDKWIKELCPRSDGLNPVYHSQMELGGDVYTAVLRDWASTVKVAQGKDDLRAFLAKDALCEHITSPHPGLLYGLNSSGLFLKQGASERPSSEMLQLRHEVDAIRQQGIEGLQTVFAAQAQTRQEIATLGNQLNTSLTAIGNLAAQHNLSSRTLQLDMLISELRQERSSKETMLCLPGIAPDIRANYLRRIQECEHELVDLRQQRDELRDQQNALTFNTSAPLAIVGAPPGIPAPTQPRAQQTGVATTSHAANNTPPAPTPAPAPDQEQQDGQKEMEITNV
ncbi:hypothetical protein K466DRAFT_587024, partial [Polyporus arcularius HHB13444]